MIYQGETKTLAVTILDPARAPVDITGAQLDWRLKRTIAGEVLLVLEGVITDAPAGELTVSLSSLHTDIEPGMYVHELRVTLDGDVTTVLQGPFTVARSLFA